MPDSLQHLSIDVHRARVDDRTATIDRIPGIAAFGATLGLAAVCWVIALHQMSGMAMGVSTRLGSFGFFLTVWALMMAAMMLPSAGLWI